MRVFCDAGDESEDDGTVAIDPVFSSSCIARSNCLMLLATFASYISFCRRKVVVVSHQAVAVIVVPVVSVGDGDAVHVVNVACSVEMADELVVV